MRRPRCGNIADHSDETRCCWCRSSGIALGAVHVSHVWHTICGNCLPAVFTRRQSAALRRLWLYDELYSHEQQTLS